MKKGIVMLVTPILLILGLDLVMAAGYQWKNHAAPYDFLLGNDIDSHQQTRLERDGSLFGFFYIKFTDDFTYDGYPVATHANCKVTPDCTVGWVLRGNPGSATFLYHGMADQPVWLANRADIPQPGAYTHFRWLGGNRPVAGVPRNGYFLELQAVDTFCFIHHGMAIVSRDTCQENAGVVVTPGVDSASHVNIVTSFPPGIVPGI